MSAPYRASLFCWALPLLLLAATPLSLAAQDVTGALQGTVTSAEGRPEPEVRVTVAGPHLQGTRETVTDRGGFFEFLALPPGTYELKAARVGLQPIEVRGIVVDLGRATAVGPLTLVAQPIEMKPVEVQARPLTIDPVHTTAGGTLNARDYDALPVDRDYKSLIAILPHVNDSYRGDPLNVGGATGLENQYYIDGVNVTDTRVADRATSLPHNFVRQVDVKTGGYEAQYGRASGGIINAVTYTGTNEFEAETFGFVQPVAMSMKPRVGPALAEAGAVSYDVGARLSGPLVRDRLWYSAAFNPRVDQVDKEIPGQGSFLDRTRALRFATKLTWRATPATNVELSVFGDPTNRDQIFNMLLSSVGAVGGYTILNPAAILGREESGGTTASLRATAAPSQSLLLQASAAQQWGRRAFEGQRPGAPTEAYVDHVERTVSGGYGLDVEDERDRTSLTARGTVMLHRHTVVVGAEYEDARVQSAMDLRVTSRRDSTRWVKAHEAYSGTFHNRSPAAYLQDTWRVTDRFALNAGLRWSGQSLVGASGNVDQKITDEWQPRVGFNWQLGGRGAQGVFGSYGRYYETLPTNLAVFMFVDYLAIYEFYSSDPRLPGTAPDEVLDGSSLESDFARQIPGLQAENFDEFTLGYERLLGSGNRLTFRGIRRELRSSYQWGQNGYEFVLGTPGKGDFGFLPAPKREYTALEISAEGGVQRLRYRTSYVLSRSWGNYPGLYNSDVNLGNPGQVTTFFAENQAVNSTGYLPNDRTHVFKLSAAYEAGSGLVGGAFLTLASGAPINEFAAGPLGPGLPSFLVQRGTAGRTPALWNLDLRLTYALPLVRGPRTRIQADVLHIGNPRRALQVDEMHYPLFDQVAGNVDLSAPNPNYRQPVACQPPMAVRLGAQVSF